MTAYNLVTEKDQLGAISLTKLMTLTLFAMPDSEIDRLAVPVCSLDLQLFVSIANAYLETMEANDADDVFEIIGIFMTSQCANLDLVEELQADIEAAFEAGNQLTKKMLAAKHVNKGNNLSILINNKFITYFNFFRKWACYNSS